MLDVPHTLKGVGQQVADEYHFEATASVNRMVNQNSSGFQSDITLNQIDVVEYRFDSGDWVVSSNPETPAAEIAFQVSVPTDALQIEIRTRSTIFLCKRLQPRNRL